jgi:hypothetical protein
MTEQEVIDRINIQLEQVDDGQELKKAETEEEALRDGRYYIDEINFDREEDEETPRPDFVIVKRHVDLESLAHKLGVLADDDEIEYADGEGPQ